MQFRNRKYTETAFLLKDYCISGHVCMCYIIRYSELVIYIRKVMQRI